MADPHRPLWHAKFQAMPRGRHRHSQPLHRLLPPLTVAGSAALFAGGAWAVADPVILRAIAAAAAAAACVGAVLLRSWDRSAGKQVADLEAARVRDEWRTDERIAELEVDLDDSRELRGRLENKLRTKRAELARLRSEHADLLRRYATAESERASALERRRQLAIETAAAPAAVPVAGAPADQAAYARADEALRNLGRNAARQQALRTVDEARRRDAEHSREEQEPQGRHAAASADSAGSGGSGGSEEHGSAAQPPALPVRQHQLVPAVAAAVLPYAKPQRTASRAQGGFDFFGTQTPKALGPAPAKAPASDPDSDPAPAPAKEDLADVVGDEAVAEHEAGQLEVIDLTVHDETEQLDVRELRVRSS
ncbi:MAG: hypothetical protein QOF44_1123 [Streptomyces sp.]|nr:hypothetical protein [Streptomyces sp.]